MPTKGHDWHGWGIGRDSDGNAKRALHIGTLPGRKSVCLYVMDGNVMRTLAFFRGEKDAAEAMRFIDDIVDTVARGGVRK